MVKNRLIIISMLCSILCIVVIASSGDFTINMIIHYYIDHCAYLIFVTGATGGARVNFVLAGVNSYRFNAKNWQFTV